MPHLQTLVERHKDDPFVLLGINHGDSKEAFRKGLAQYNVTWQTAYQESGKELITKLYGIQGFPTYYLIGPDGKILGSGHGGEAFDEKIAMLVKIIKESAKQ